MISSRRAEPGDVNLFREVRLRALQDSPDAYGSTYEGALKRDLASWEEQLASTTSGGFRNTQFAFEDGKCVGLAALYREATATSGDVIMMWVDPCARSSLAASSLIENLLKWAEESGLLTVQLSVTDTNTRAIRFYEKHGFILTGEEVDIDPARQLRGVRMKYQLAPPG